MSRLLSFRLSYNRLYCTCCGNRIYTIALWSLILRLQYQLSRKGTRQFSYIIILNGLFALISRTLIKLMKVPLPFHCCSANQLLHWNISMDSLFNDR